MGPASDLCTINSGSGETPNELAYNLETGFKCLFYIGKCRLSTGMQ